MENRDPRIQPRRSSVQPSSHVMWPHPQNNPAQTSRRTVHALAREILCVCVCVFSVISASILCVWWSLHCPFWLLQDQVCQAPSIWHDFDVEIQGARAQAATDQPPLVCVSLCVCVCVYVWERDTCLDKHYSTLTFTDLLDAAVVACTHPERKYPVLNQSGCYW